MNAYPVHRPNWLTVAGADLSGVVATIVITVVLGRFSCQEADPRLGRVDQCHRLVGPAPGSARAVRVTATIPSVRQLQHFSVRRCKPESFRVK